MRKSKKNSSKKKNNTEKVIVKPVVEETKEIPPAEVEQVKEEVIPEPVEENLFDPSTKMFMFGVENLSEDAMGMLIRSIGRLQKKYSAQVIIQDRKKDRYNSINDMMDAVYEAFNPKPREDIIENAVPCHPVFAKAITENAVPFYLTDCPKDRWNTIPGVVYWSTLDIYTVKGCKLYSSYEEALADNILQK